LSDNTENPQVSIIVPVYNTERYLKQCVNSLLYQTFKNIEIIIVDDGSTDNCPAICDAYAEWDRRIKVIHQRNSGHGKACNTGISAVKGEYFCIVESDYYVELDMYEKLYNLAKSHNLDAASYHYYAYNSMENTHKRIDLSHIPQNIICSPMNDFSLFFKEPTIWSMLYKTSFITKNNIKFLETPEASYQDSSFTFKVLALADKLMLVDNAFVHYRVNNENSLSLAKDKVFCIFDEFKEIERFIKERGLQEKLMLVIPKIKFPAYIWNYHRVARKARWVFLEAFAKEMRTHISNKTISKEIYSAKEIAKIYLIAFLFPLFYCIPYIS
jgi:glycosyltransferase involved in cell wall biosynthesis